VFDSFLEAKHSASFIAGNQMILPIGTKRVDDKKFEEMTIPAPNKPPAEIIDRFKLINVADLDGVAQVGFAGVERLNQIQSIVYETAYNSNENMLVCAPTGAGKTNIAMLTILHEIRSNLTEDGTLRLNDFKIIYIAPMKALVAEMVDNFTKKLKPFGILVRELTGDMQMTKAEISKTQMIVTTPEKWDVITRKTSGISLLQQVKLTIIDEVHLLESDRGSVLEALVSRIIRNVEASQQMSRLVGLSATLPNYKDVAEFLSVSLNKGMFVFDNRFRPVPLELCFVGIKALGQAKQIQDMDEVLYDKVKTLVSQGHQVMVFVHSRNATSKTASNLLDEAGKRGELQLFQFDDYDGMISRATRQSRHKMLHELMPNGFAIHHAGLLRPDRNIVEKLFRDGGIKVLCCTATLAWGVNLPAHAVVIRGTDIYDPTHGGFVDISMLDVMQIFGRAGRPQYDTSGFACIITAHQKLAHYLSMLTCQFPIESQFMKYITDNLNAEIVAGTVSDVTEGCFWLGYTYLFVRMKKNPLAYGLSYEDLKRDPYLQMKKRQLIIDSARELDAAKMIEFDQEKETFKATDLGKTASHYYIKYDTIVSFNEKIEEDMMEDVLLRMLCSAQEFDQLKSREEEIEELVFLKNHSCKLQVKDSVDSREGKVNILLQACLSRARYESFSLNSDAAYVQQNIVRLVRGVFEYSRKSHWAGLAHKTLLLSKMLDKRMWNFQTPFLQFCKKELDDETLSRLDQNRHLTPQKIKNDPEMSPEIIGRIVRNSAKGKVIKDMANWFPLLRVLVKTTVLTQFQTLYQLLVEIEYTPDFVWNDFYHGKVQGFWMWIYDPDTYVILHHEYVIISKLQVKEKKGVSISFRMPVDNSVIRMVLHVDSDHWLGCESDHPISLGFKSGRDDISDANQDLYFLSAFKNEQDTRDITENVRMYERVRDRETKEDRAHLYPKGGNNNQRSSSGPSYNGKQSGGNRGSGGRGRNSGGRSKR
jgi:activating signal cointegrator complex subunit 3